MLLHFLAVLTAFTSAANSQPIVEWTFDAPADAAAWEANSHLGDVRIEDGALAARATGNDPFFVWKDGPAFEASPWNCVVLRARADKPGTGQLFWTGTTEGPYGGFSQEKTTPFNLAGTGEWETVFLLPFWQAEGRIIKLRLDLYGGASFAIDNLSIQRWGAGQEPQTGVYSWSFPEDAARWSIPAGTDRFYAPPIRLDVSAYPWVAVVFDAENDAMGELLWASDQARGEQHMPFEIRAGTGRVANIPMSGVNEWQSPLVALGLRIPEAAGVRVHSVSIAKTPAGPADLHVLMLGFDAAVNRAGRPARLAAVVENRGGEPSPATEVTLTLGEGLNFEGEETPVSLPALAPGERFETAWTLVADAPGHYPVSLTLGEDYPFETELRVEATVEVAEADYVPEPCPVETDIEILAYYFPGWETDAKWDPIRNTAPIRKPLLGYYDEANPEIVDWQIKWAVENGISCFLVDWYWTEGRQYLRHWFDAYREARYRNHLDVAIMWANHNAPNTHSAEDWKAVTQEWIDNYFGMETYYRIDGKPAVFIWAPSNITRDLGGSDAVKAAFDTSQEMARAAGYPGIAYVALGYETSPGRMETLKQEGYMGFTMYHEWGESVNRSPVPRRARFEDVVATVPGAWRAKEAASAGLVYFPVAETGWDSRPWHGPRGLAIEGRTPALFEQLLRDLKVFAEEHGKKQFILAPINEWGEGSYIEPNREFGFEMYEAIRRVFAKGDPASWPVNLAPSDLGLGPYDFAAGETRSAWSFDRGLGGWRSLMNTENLRAEEGAMRFRTETDDAAVTVRTSGFNANDWAFLVLEMQLDGAVPTGSEGQLYWTPKGGQESEAASVRFPLKTDNGLHTYRIRLDAIPAWTGELQSLRFDPCASENIQVAVHAFRFETN